MQLCLKVTALAVTCLFMATFAYGETADRNPEQEIFTLNTLLERIEPTLESKVDQQIDTEWLLPEFAPTAVQSAFICDTPPPTCVCGSCCECYVCWIEGLFPYLGCD